MSNPWLPTYLGSWERLIDALLHPRHGGDRQRVILSTHAMKPDPDAPMPGPGLGPGPSPWPVASSLITAISLREVASQMSEGRVKVEFAKRLDSAIARFIDDCGTKPPRWPWPWPHPGPHPGPPPWVYEIVSELAVAANGIAEGKVRNEILRVAGQIVERASGSIEERK